MAEVALLGTGAVVESAAPKIDVNAIRAQLEGIRDSLQPLMSGGSGGFGLSEVSLELGVSASGEVGFIVAKTDLELSASITLTFTRS